MPTTSPQQTPFTLRAPQDTDIWRKPTSTNVFNAPHTLQDPIPLTSFTRVRATFSAAWTQQYDQAGILLLLTPKGAGAASIEESGLKYKWLKTGIEFYNGQPQISTVGCDRWADWSILPASADDKSWTVEVQREQGKDGKGLWVYQLILGEDGNVKERKPVREITWFFDGEEEWEVRIGAMLARPAQQGGELEVKFEGFEVETRE